ncbi:hypothetical protein BD310DRAFT_829936 [Dichomitus squalens]|uniref:Uncharacterized protein n=1 Tax=Dichomitus squalens TaxID=114155 RepID=A0A4V2K6U6_9APHY|nr:hypothetical protein BD310DRAFT_829936 [Dichomitus squalens]
MFRLPTHLESLVPPPREQVPQTQPWRGRIFTPAAFPDPTAQPCEIRVTAAETEYDNSQQELWPEHFQLQVIRRRGVLSELHGWLTRLHQNPYPRCMLMPDRLADHTATRRNHALFEEFARTLLDEEIVAIAPWGYSDSLQHGGILLYPTASTRSLLVGIVFLNTGFPDFVQGSSPHPMVAGPSRGGVPLSLPQGNLLPRTHPFQPVMHHSPFDPAPPNIASSSRYSSTSGYDGTRSGRSSG